jgi:hypothetical protein
MTTLVRSVGVILVAAALSQAQAPKAPQTASDVLRENFADVNRKILEMAKDFPGDKYDFKLKPETRSFRELIVHIASGNEFAGKAGKGEKVKWDELDAKNYANKAAAVALMEKSIADATAAIKVNPMGPAKNLDPFLSVMEHSAEHYGLLVGYYRANGLVPPESRPKK